MEKKREYVVGPSGEFRPDDPNGFEQGILVGRLLTGDITEEEVRRKLLEEDDEEE